MSPVSQISDEHLQPVLEALPVFGEKSRHPLLTFLDADGFPFSVRVSAEWTGDCTFKLLIPDAAPLDETAAPASLLWHTHDKRLESLASALLRGRLTTAGPAVAFRATHPPTLSGIGETDWTTMFETFERSAESYLRDYGLTPPVIDWSAYERLVAEVRSRT